MLEDRGSQEETDRGDLFVRLNLVGESPAFRRATTLISRVARCDATALIQGETGTGKEVAARAIHYLGARREHAFVPINCAGLPDSLLESELFGHERGAFTDARERRQGLLAEARGGTLPRRSRGYERAHASGPAQVLAGQVLQALGSNTLIDSDVRLVAASNADLGVLSQQGLFRRDLLFRLSVLVVPLPPLRERRGDAEILAESFLDRFSKTYGFPRRTLSSVSRQWLASYGWPGNVRELESLVLRELLLGDGAGDEIDLTSSHLAPGEESVSDLDEPGAEIERIAVLPRSQGGSRCTFRAQLPAGPARSRQRQLQPRGTTRR